ncbi:Discoidin domain-containing receptor 2 [Exaiptasia diaphana]|nr:Discoidin domain-containing receptor 2 [Exaiptasia diaphana]
MVTDNRNCQDLGDIPNGIIINNGFKHGDKISIRCKNGFRIKGSPELICNNGQWDSPKPKCVANCLDPGHPTNGERQGDLFNHLQTVSFSCKRNFTMIGSSKIQCNDGRWTSGIPYCTECGSPLGMENGKIPDKNIRASSRLDNGHDARYGRLHGSRAWCPEYLRAEDIFYRVPSCAPHYLEVDLEKPYKITYIATQGSARDNKWVTNYTLSHSLAKSSRIEYKENDKEKVFNGNSDATTVMKHKLKNSFIARKVRFGLFGYRFPRCRFDVFNWSTSCMRVEIYGCELPTDCVMVGSRVLGKWGSSYRGFDYYYKSYVKAIDDTHDEVDLEIEDDEHPDDTFKTISKAHVVPDDPNKQLNLPPDTRVLVPWNNKYYTGNIERSETHYYLVRFDFKTLAWFYKKEIRLLKPTQFCER